ncbi:MAG: phosphatase PAP2 family protein, partial [Deltaproteobacteria bacterium]|nr:phosphatase PAP2 family protein [Deltaproteobacteria bacterium]
HMVTALTFVFIIGFLCYILLPCNPPRYLIPHLYSHPPKLYGLFLYDTLQGAWDGMSVISGGAFPSLHVAISSIALLYGFRLRHLSRLFCILHFVTAPLVVGVWVATIYLRHHWVIDIVAGLVVAIVAMLLSQYALRWGMRKRLALPLSDS